MVVGYTRVDYLKWGCCLAGKKGPVSPMPTYGITRKMRQNVQVGKDKAGHIKNNSATLNSAISKSVCIENMCFESILATQEFS